MVSAALLKLFRYQPFSVSHRVVTFLFFRFSVKTLLDQLSLVLVADKI